MSYGFHLGLVTEKVTASDGTLARGTAVIDINRGTVTATLNSVPDTGGFDLWFVKNVAGGTVAPEVTDQMLKVGSFQGTGPSPTLTASLGANVFFDLEAENRAGGPGQEPPPADDPDRQRDRYGLGGADHPADPINDAGAQEPVYFALSWPSDRRSATGIDAATSPSASRG